MARASREQATQTEFSGFGRYAGPATLILSSLADGPKHGYVLTKDIEAFSGTRLAPARSMKRSAVWKDKG